MSGSIIDVPSAPRDSLEILVVPDVIGIMFAAKPNSGWRYMRRSAVEVPVSRFKLCEFFICLDVIWVQLAAADPVQEVCWLGVALF